jgi:hypothetical protein
MSRIVAFAHRYASHVGVIDASVTLIITQHIGTLSALAAVLCVLDVIFYRDGGAL